MNLFLPPFPEAGLTLDYVDQVNAIFAAFSIHTHEPNSQDAFNLPNGNRVESDSIFWSTLDISANMLNVRSLNLYDQAGPIGFVNYLNVFDGDLYFIKSGVGAIQITNRPYVNASATITGFIGDFQAYGVSLLFDTDTNDYTFTSNLGKIGMSVNTLEAGNVHPLSIDCNTLVLTDAPDQTPNNDGYAYFNSNGIFEYSKLSVIKLDHTTEAAVLVYDNLVTANRPAFGFPAYPRYNLLGVNERSGLIIYSNQPGVAPALVNKYAYSDIWFPLATPDNLQWFQGQFIDPASPSPEAFYGAESVPIWNATTGLELVNNNLRLVYGLNRLSNASWDTTRINHYQFHPVILDFSSNYVRHTSDFLIENTTPTKIEKLVLIDINATGIPKNESPLFYYLLQFHFDFGTQPI